MKSNPLQELFQIASRQQGYFTAKQAMHAGYDLKNSTYQLRRGHWSREYRGIYRLVHFPQSAEGELILWSLWSKNQQDVPQGIYSYETALRIYDVSDSMPSKLHLTVPSSFRRRSPLPSILILHRQNLSPLDIEEKNGYRVTAPLRTIIDLVYADQTEESLISQAIREFTDRGLLTQSEITHAIQTYPELHKYFDRNHRAKERA